MRWHLCDEDGQSTRTTDADDLFWARRRFAPIPKGWAVISDASYQAGVGQHDLTTTIRQRVGRSGRTARNERYRKRKLAEDAKWDHSRRWARRQNTAKRLQSQAGHIIGRIIEGAPVDLAAQEFGVSRQALHDLRVAHGCPSPSEIRTRQWTLLNWYYMHLGHSQSEIARRLGTARLTVRLLPVLDIPFPFALGRA